LSFRRIVSILSISLITFALLCTSGCLGRSQPESKRELIFKGVTYIRDVKRTPRPMVIHAIIVDLRASGISTLVTPGDPKLDLPLKAMTTSQFLSKYNVQVAINGDSFTPWHSRSVLDYYPHKGDPVAPLGFAASKGIAYAEASSDALPTLYISRTNQAQFNAKIGNLYNAISGTTMLVRWGQVVSGLAKETELNPRSAVGLDKVKKKLILMVIDGRQPGYSEGATLAETAALLISYGAYEGMNLDGGGSATLVMQSRLGFPQVLNSPINHGIPGWERPVANHLGIFAERGGE